MSQVIRKIRSELQKNVDVRYKKGFSKYFGGKIKSYGVRTPYVRRIAKKYFAEIKYKQKQEIFQLCEEFLRSGINEEATIAFQWAFNLKNQYEKTDFILFEKWLKKYVTNWAKCDDFCTHSFGYFILKFPEYLPHIKNKWVQSEKRFLRRGAAVILIPAIKKDKKFLCDVFDVADILLLDKADLVRKGYGWLLKETANKYQAEVFDYVMRHKNYMPRVSLRYAIEKMSQEMRQQALAK